MLSSHGLFSKVTETKRMIIFPTVNYRIVDNI